MNRNFFPLLLLSGLLLAQCGKKENTEAAGAAEAGGVQMFTLLDPKTCGVQFTNVIEESPQRHYSNFNPIYDGGGVAIGDINNDGLPDLYFTGNEVPNQLFLNKGNLQFENITTAAGVAGTGGWKNGVSMADVNGDGLLDIYVCKGGWLKDPAQRKNLLYINKGNLKFSEEAEAYGLADAGYSFQSAFFDFDKDGDLDVFVVNHPDKSNLKLEEYIEGRKNGAIYCKSRLYRNDNQRFVDITDQAGLSQTYSFGLSVSTADLDNNGYLDIYVTNDYNEPDYFFLNNGNGAFTESVKQRLGHISLFSMGIDIADLNNDGQEDIFVTEMLPEDYKRSKINMATMNAPMFNRMVEEGFHHCYMHNMLQLNMGNGYFSDVSQLAGVAKTDWSWACFMSDFDNDGLRDIFVANGYRRDLYDKDAINKMREYFEQHKGKKSDINEVMSLYNSEKLINYVYKNKGQYQFAKVSEAWGMGQPTFSNGAAIADLDNDGDLDMAINNLNQEAYVYRNNAEKTGHKYLRVKLEGPNGNREGLGAKVSIHYGGVQQMEQLKLNRGYLGTMEPVAHFGLGQVSAVDEIRVEWLDGKQSVVKNPQLNTEVSIAYANAAAQAGTTPPTATLLKESTNSAFSKPFKHQENAYDDYKTQILLPHRQSQNGPFVGVADVNGDGLEDFYVGGAAGQAGALYLQNANGQFQPKTVPAFAADAACEDMGALFFDADGDKDQDLYVVSGGFEFPAGSPLYQDRLYLNDGKGNFSKSAGLPIETASGSCAVATDFDGDGDLDLFVGGRVIPDKYPYPPNNFLFINEKGVFTDKTAELAKELSQIGMVCSALWMDLNADQKPDLVLAGEWMPITALIQEGGVLVNRSSNYFEGPLTGWWNKLVAADIDGDGDQDLVAGNLGLNYKFSASPEKPFQVYCDDFDQNGSWDIVLAKYAGKEIVPIRGRECSSQQMPFVADKFPTYRAFAEADLFDIYGKKIETALSYKADNFASCILIREQGKFTVKKLPLEAQFSSVHGIIPSDFDGDGDLDLLLGGNMFHSEVETTRNDASFGALLTRGADQQYTAQGYLQTGFFIPYDVKDLQAIRVGKGKKTGVLVACNNGLLRLFTANGPALQ